MTESLSTQRTFDQVANMSFLAFASSYPEATELLLSLPVEKRGPTQQQQYVNKIDHCGDRCSHLNGVVLLVFFFLFLLVVVVVLLLLFLMFVDVPAFDFLDFQT